MSEATAEATAQLEEMPAPVFETRPPFDLSDGLRTRVDGLDLGETVEHVKEHGYGYIHDAASPEFVARLRQTIVRIVRRESRHRLGGNVPLVNMLLPKDPVFEEVVLNPKLLTIAEILCGKGALLSQAAATLKEKATEPGDGKGACTRTRTGRPRRSRCTTSS